MCAVRFVGEEVLVRVRAGVGYDVITALEGCQLQVLGGRSLESVSLSASWRSWKYFERRVHTLMRVWYAND